MLKKKDDKKIEKEKQKIHQQTYFTDISDIQVGLINDDEYPDVVINIYKINGQNDLLFILNHLLTEEAVT